MVNLEELKDRLVVLRSWYSGRAERPERETFRSLGVSDESIADGDPETVVDSVVEKRAAGGGLVEGDESKRTGRLLLLYLDENLMDGAAAVASGGFYGGLNFPPCDLWLAILPDLSPFGGATKRALVAWIPDESFDEAQKGIDVNPEECLEWASEGAPALSILEAQS